MYIIMLTYKKPLAEIDRCLAEHRQFLARHYAAGHFLFSGRQEPRVGGVILAKAQDRAEVERIVCEDPFHREGIADYEIIEFVASMTAEALTGFKEEG
jgi:uncharacterized protein YciI